MAIPGVGRGGQLVSLVLGCLVYHLLLSDGDQVIERVLGDTRSVREDHDGEDDLRSEAHKRPLPCTPQPPDKTLRSI